MSVKRYKLGSYRHYSEVFPDLYCDIPELVPDQKGTWIKDADYDTLAQELAALKQAGCPTCGFTLSVGVMPDHPLARRVKTAKGSTTMACAYCLEQYNLKQCKEELARVKADRDTWRDEAVWAARMLMGESVSDTCYRRAKGIVERTGRS